jgi:hypothetical protein
MTGAYPVQIICSSAGGSSNLVVVELPQGPSSAHGRGVIELCKPQRHALALQACLQAQSTRAASAGCCCLLLCILTINGLQAACLKTTAQLLLEPNRTGKQIVAAWYCYGFE